MCILKSPKSTSVQKINQVHPFCNQKDTLAVFDVDMVLTQPEEPAFQIPNMTKHHQAAKEIFKGIDPFQKEILLNLMVTQHGSTLIEEEAPAVIQELKEKHIPTIALTAALSKNAHWRLSTLHSLGFQFSFNDREEITFNRFTQYLEGRPLFLKGIVFANGESGPSDKGSVLVDFLAAVDHYPRRVVFVDDKPENLEDVDNALKKLDPQIEFIGLHYQGAAKYAAHKVSEEEFVSRWQMLIAEATVSWGQAGHSDIYALQTS